MENDILSLSVTEDNKTAFSGMELGSEVTIKLKGQLRQMDSDEGGTIILDVTDVALMGGKKEMKKEEDKPSKKSPAVAYMEEGEDDDDGDGITT